MRWILVLLALTTQARAGAFIYGDCGECHTAVPSNLYYHIDQLFFDDKVPAGDGIFRTWGASNNMPETPIPGALVLFGSGLALLGARLIRKP